MTWQFLRDADARQINANMNLALEADNRLVTGTVLNRLFDPHTGFQRGRHQRLRPLLGR